MNEDIPATAVVCKAALMSKAKMIAAGPMVDRSVPDPIYQPHIKETITPKQKGSKWDTREGSKATAGSMMIDTGKQGHSRVNDDRHREGNLCMGGCDKGLSARPGPITCQQLWRLPSGVGVGHISGAT